jgi:DNA-binding NtrC family response regulator
VLPERTGKNGVDSMSLIHIVEAIVEQAKPFNRPTVFVVKDDADERFLVSMLFKGSDLDVIECGSGEAASTILDEKPDEIVKVFTDIRLSGKMDDVDLAQASAAGTTTCA